MAQDNRYQEALEHTAARAVMYSKDEPERAVWDLIFDTFVKLASGFVLVPGGIVSSLRCEFTKNLVGTDTRQAGFTCGCAPCRTFEAAIAAASDAGEPT